MLHWHYVGHFDPCDAFDRSHKPLSEEDEWIHTV